MDFVEPNVPIVSAPISVVEACSNLSPFHRSLVSCIGTQSVHRAQLHATWIIDMEVARRTSSSGLNGVAVGAVLSDTTGAPASEAGWLVAAGESDDGRELLLCDGKFAMPAVLSSRAMRSLPRTSLEGRRVRVVSGRAYRSTGTTSPVAVLAVDSLEIDSRSRVRRPPPLALRDALDDHSVRHAVGLTTVPTALSDGSETTESVDDAEHVRLLPAITLAAMACSTLPPGRKAKRRRVNEDGSIECTKPRAAALLPNGALGVQRGTFCFKWVPSRKDGSGYATEEVIDAGDGEEGLSRRVRKTSARNGQVMPSRLRDVGDGRTCLRAACKRPIKSGEVIASLCRDTPTRARKSQQPSVAFVHQMGGKIDEEKVLEDGDGNDMIDGFIRRKGRPDKVTPEVGGGVGETKKAIEKKKKEKATVQKQEKLKIVQPFVTVEIASGPSIEMRRCGCNVCGCGALPRDATLSINNAECKMKRRSKRLACNSSRVKKEVQVVPL